MKNTGVAAQDIFIEAFESRKFWVHRFRDSKDVNGLNSRKGVGRVAMFTCPADFLVGGEGTLFLGEVKSTYDRGRFSYGDVRPAQRAAASFSASRLFPYYFFILDLNTDQWYVLSGQQFIDDIKAGKKSRSFQELTPCSLMSWSM
jgi:hypothetical protein